MVSSSSENLNEPTTCKGWHSIGPRDLSFLFLSALVSALTWTWPLVLHLNDGYLTHLETRDPLLVASYLDHILDWFARPEGSLFDAPFFHPEKQTLAMTEMLVGEAILGSPARLFTGEPIAVLNVSFLLANALTFLGAALLAFRFHGDRSSALLAGLIYSCSCWTVAQSGHLQNLHTQWLPFALLCLEGWIWKRKWVSLVGLTFVLIAQSWSGWYQTFVLLIGIAVWSVFRIRSFDWKLLLPFLAFAVSIAFAAQPYLALQERIPNVGREMDQIIGSVDLADPLLPPRFSLWFGWLPFASDRWIEHLVFLGTLPSILVLIGLFSRGWRGWWLAMGVVGWILSLGPSLRIAGMDTGIPLPYRLFFETIPGWSAMRVPSRFWPLVVLAMALLAPLAIPRVAAFLSPRWRSWAGCLAVGLCALELWAIRLQMGEPPKPRAVHVWLEEEFEGWPVLTLPMPPDEVGEDTELAKTLYLQRFQGHPLVDGSAGYVPPGHVRLRKAIQEFPDAESQGAIRKREPLLIHLDLQRMEEPNHDLDELYRDERDLILTLPSEE